MAVTEGDDIEIIRGDTFIYPFTFLADLTAYTKLWFTVKDDKDDTDAQAIIQIIESNPGAATDGLLAIAGGTPTALGNGSITLSSLPLGNGTVRVEAVETAKLDDTGNFYYDFQYQNATNTLTARRGRATISGDTTRTV